MYLTRYSIPYSTINAIFIQNKVHMRQNNTVRRIDMSGELPRQMPTQNSGVMDLELCKKQFANDGFVFARKLFNSKEVDQLLGIERRLRHAVRIDHGHN